MSFGKHFTRFASIALALALAGCGSSSDGGGGNPVLGAVQNLTADPTGLTTTITFTNPPGPLSTSQFTSSGTQNPVMVVVAGAQANVTWDARVTPSDTVRVTGIPDTAARFISVSSSDASAPTFTITDASQNPGLGTDTLEITFAGPRVVEALVEDPTNWELRIGSTVLDLTGSTFDLDNSTQVLDITLGSAANLHAAFTLEASNLVSVSDVAIGTVGQIVGAATGDTSAPTLVSANQNLAEDEFGRVVDFTFNEAMDPIFSTGLSHFGVTLPEVATSVSQPTEDVLRVTFSGPVVPGVDTVTFNGLVDAHGNAYPDGPQVIAQPSPVVNSFDGFPTAETVENALNDVITIVTTQAFDPSVAELPASWTLNVDSTPIDLSLQTLDYDFLTKTLTITLNFDMTNGDSFDITGNVLEVDGQTFATLYAGTVAGDSTVPTIASVSQNRTVDATGQTIDVTVSEDVDPVAAQNTANWGVTGGITVLSATLQPNQNDVRLVLDAPAVPGDETVSASSLVDLAGNAMPAPETLIPITSSDSTAPAPVVATANAVEGALNDTVVVVFNDAMIEAEVENDANWTIESPVGTALTMTGASISYNPASQRTTIVFGAGTDVNFQRDDDFRITASTMRDVGGNAVSATPVSGNVIAETNLPDVHTIYRDSINADEVVIRFTEPCGHLDDVYDAVSNQDGTRYVLRDSGGSFIANATGATSIDDGLGARVSFGVVVNPTDTIDVIAAQDLAGNPLFPALLVPTVAEDLTLPSLDTGVSTVVSFSGEANDVATIVFDRPMSPWQLTNPDNYAVDPGSPIDLSGAVFDFDGDRTVTIRIEGRDNFQTGGAHDITVNNVFTAQGTQRTVADTEIGVVATGDVVLPDVLAADVKLDPIVANSLLIEVDEAIDKTAAETPGTYDYNSGTFATGAALISPRTVRVTFPSAVTDTVDLDFTVTDLAGNATGVLTRTVAVADTTAPLVIAPVGTSVEGEGGDYVVVGFNEPVDPTVAININNYDVHNGGRFLDLTDAFIVYDSSTLTVTIHLPAGQELYPTDQVTVTLTDISDLSGNVFPAPRVVAGGVSGDTVEPSITSAYANYRRDAGGLIFDVLFSEDVDPTFAADETNWSASGGQNVLDVTLVNSNFVRVTLDAPLNPAETLDIVSGLPDLAQNLSVGVLSVVPEL